MQMVQCPNCKKEVVWSLASPFRPFCSERCRKIDLGGWADGSYSIPLHTPVAEEDDQNSQNSDDMDTGVTSL